MFGSTSQTSPPYTGKQKSMGTVTKNLRDRVKRSEWAVGLLRDLEEEVRRYAAGLFGCSAGSVSRCSSVTPDEQNKEKEKKRQKRGGKRKLKTRHGGTGRSSRSSSISSSTSSIVVVSDTEGGVGLVNNEHGEGERQEQEQEVEVAVVEGEEGSVKDSEDEEIVFVPKMARMSLEDGATEPQPPASRPAQSSGKDGAVVTTDEEEVEQVQLEKPMFEAPASDPSASFV